MQIHQPPCAADVLVVLGSIDDRVARVAARLYEHYDYGAVVVTGGNVERNSRQAAWTESTEAEHFARIFPNSCNLRSEIILETAAQNTGQNVTLSYAALDRAGVEEPKTIMIVTKPYMERRALGAFEAQWPGKAGTRFFVHSSGQLVWEYCMPEYAKCGWQTDYSVPNSVNKAAAMIRNWLELAK